MFGLKSKKKDKIKEDVAFLAQQLLFEGTGASTVFDIGAYVGKISQRYQELFSEATIYSFEPFPDSFAQLSEAAGSSSRIKPFNCAVSDSPGKATFNINTDRTCNSLFDRPVDTGKYYSEKSKNVNQIEVETTTVDQFCVTNGIKKIDILKIDVEGAETKVFDGAKQMFADNRIGIVYTEVMFVKHYEGGCMYHHIASHLEQYGFTLLNIYNMKRASNGQLRYGNAIFLGPEKRRQIDSRI